MRKAANKGKGGAIHKTDREMQNLLEQIRNYRTYSSRYEPIVHTRVGSMVRVRVRVRVGILSGELYLI